jgi:hypothetical protein
MTDRCSGSTYIFKMNNITRNHFLGIYLQHVSISGHSSLQSQCLFEAVDDVSSMVFLSETNDCIENQQGADDPEVNPIPQSGSQDCRELFKFFVSMLPQANQARVCA